MSKFRYITMYMLQAIVFLLLLSVVFIQGRELPRGEMIAQNAWLDKIAVFALGCFLLSIIISSKREWTFVDKIVSYVLLILGSVEVVWGLMQLYGFAISNHALYKLTGSFYNPGPYSGYLAVIFPICLYFWLAGNKIEKSFGAIVGLSILCVLPTGMSRSAWIALVVSSLFVYGAHIGCGRWIKRIWKQRKYIVLLSIVCGLFFLLLIGFALFQIKSTSANGRLFMWKISCRAIAEKPWTGHGIGNFAAAYGNAQESYFAQGDYDDWEEQVAGSPDAGFNEYLQLAIEIGIPLTIIIIGIVILCFWIGFKKRRLGICGALLALAVFAFSSYPFQIPAFVILLYSLLVATFVGQDKIKWSIIVILPLLLGIYRIKTDQSILHAARRWKEISVLYSAKYYQDTANECAYIYPELKMYPYFLAMYGHCLHEMGQWKSSTQILKEALLYSNNPMILNIIGCNYYALGNYMEAEHWFIRSTHRLPSRIYPYYLLAKLYADSAYHNKSKFVDMKRIVHFKKPKVMSTAIKEMREELDVIEQRWNVLNKISY